MLKCKSFVVGTSRPADSLYSSECIKNASLSLSDALTDLQVVNKKFKCCVIESNIKKSVFWIKGETKNKI